MFLPLVRSLAVALMVSVAGSASASTINFDLTTPLASGVLSTFANGSPAALQFGPSVAPFQIADGDSVVFNFWFDSPLHLLYEPLSVATAASAWLQVANPNAPPFAVTFGTSVAFFDEFGAALATDTQLGITQIGGDIRSSGMAYQLTDWNLSRVQVAFLNVHLLSGNLPQFAGSRLELIDAQYAAGQPFNSPAVPTPEPSTAVMTILGLGGYALRRAMSFRRGA